MPATARAPQKLPLTYVYGDDNAGQGGYGEASLSKSFYSTGGIGGGQIGYNVQNGRLVFGAEADLDASGITGIDTYKLDMNAAFPDPNAPITVSTAKGKSQLNYVGTLRARAGYTFDTTLVYVKGGLAFGDVSDNLPWTDSAGATTSESKNGTLTGYVLGAGAEHFLSPAWP